MVQVFVGKEATNKLVYIMWSKNVNKDYSEN